MFLVSFPSSLLLSQLGLRSIRSFTLVLPLALFLGLLMSIGRMYAENEMAVLASVTLGAQASSTPRNDLPQHYKTTRDWGQLPPGVKWAAEVAQLDGQQR